MAACLHRDSVRVLWQSCLKDRRVTNTALIGPFAVRALGQRYALQHVAPTVVGVALVHINLAAVSFPCRWHCTPALEGARAASICTLCIVLARLVCASFGAYWGLGRPRARCLASKHATALQRISHVASKSSCRGKHAFVGNVYSTIGWCCQRWHTLNWRARRPCVADRALTRPIAARTVRGVPTVHIPARVECLTCDAAVTVSAVT